MTPTVTGMRVCRQCGARLEDDEAFCRSCGALSAMAVDMSVPTETVVSNDSAPVSALEDWSRNWPVEHPQLPVYTTSGRATAATLVGGLLVLVATVPCGLLWGAIFEQPLAYSDTKVYIESEGLVWTFGPMLLLIMAGVYWCALVRLRHAGTLRTFGDSLALSMLSLLGLPALLLAGGDALHALGLFTTQPGTFFTTQPGGTFVAKYAGGEWWGWAPLAGDYLTRLVAVLPQVVVWSVLMAVISSGLMLGCALQFADWSAARAAMRPGRGSPHPAATKWENWDAVPEAVRPGGGWQEVLLLVGSLLGATLLAGLGYVWGEWVLYVLALVVSGASLSAVVAWRTYRRLQPAIRENSIILATGMLCIVRTTYVDGQVNYGAYRREAGLTDFVANCTRYADALEALGIG